MSSFRQLMMRNKTLPDIIYNCGPNTGGLWLASDRLFLWTDYDQVIVEFDAQWLSTNSNGGRVLAAIGTSTNFYVATVYRAFYWVFNDSLSTGSTSSVVASDNVKYKMRFVFDITGGTIYLTRTQLSDGTVTNWTKSAATSKYTGLGTECFSLGMRGDDKNAVTTYIWKNSILLQRVKNGVTETVWDGAKSRPGIEYIVKGATEVTL